MHRVILHMACISALSFAACSDPTNEAPATDADPPPNGSRPSTAEPSNSGLNDSGPSDQIDDVPSQGVAPDAAAPDPSQTASSPGFIIPPPSRTFATTYPGGCVIDGAGAIQCWGADAAAPWEIPEGTFTRIAAERITTCGLRTDGTIACFTTSDNNVWDAGPEGTFVDLAVGYGELCGRTQEGSVVCLGESAPQDQFLDVSVGRFFACAIRAEDRGISCWGYAGSSDCELTARVGQLDAPDGEFIQLSAKAQHACAVRTNGELACWGAGKRDTSADDQCPGAEHYGQSDPPAGQFVQVAVGDNHGCALRPDGTVACWGAGSDAALPSEYPHFGQAVAPEGEFIELSADVTRTCGLRRSGGIQCWGSDYHGDGLTPPPGFE